MEAWGHGAGARGFGDMGGSMMGHWGVGAWGGGGGHYMVAREGWRQKSD